LEDLGFPKDIHAGLRHMTEHSNGGVIFAGPAGSGKTTTAYACMREIVETAESCRSVVSLEDPIERAIPGTAQSEITAGSKIDLATGLRYMMRQDPEVIMVGEIRDKATAETCLQASLTGHLVFSTFHAGSAAQAIERLSEFGIDPYLLRSGLLGILSQRLVRRLCDCAHRHSTADDPDGALGLSVQHYSLPNGCEKCTGTGYLGRMVLAEMISLERPAVGQAVLERAETAKLEKLAIERGMVPAKKRAFQAVENGETSPTEFRRVFGIAEDPWEELDDI
jgi:type II secretory ATPase GspE/PulE/Tfp pilus assembly ATPase PilB-like protein